MVAYAMGITELNPLRHGLIFERFLNPERISMPDIDVDFDERRRDEVIEYVREKYGADRISQVVTYGVIKAKQSLKDSSRVMGYPYAVGDRLTKAMPPSVQGKDISIKGIFNPADITGLITLIYSGLKPSQVTTLAALDSTRLQSELAKYFKLPQSAVTGCSTFGGHGEQMAVFASTAKVDGTPLTDLIGTPKLPAEEWAALQQRVIKGGANIINLRGRSSFQSPAYVSVEMIRAAMGGETFRWPAGTYVSTDEFHHIMMAMPVEITKDGCAYRKVEGTPSEMADLAKSYEHLCAMRDEVIGLGVLPPVAEWSKVNPNL